MAEATSPAGEKSSASASQSRYRHEVNLPASLKITSSIMTQPFNVKDATIRYVESSAKGLALIIETKATREDLSKILVRRRTCYVACQFPGASKPSRLFGQIDLVEPRLTTQDIQVRLAVTLDQSTPQVLDDLRVFLKSLEAKGGAQPD